MELDIIMFVTLRYQGGQRGVHVPSGKLDIVEAVTLRYQGGQRGFHIPGGSLISS